MLFQERDYPFHYYPSLFHDVQMAGLFADSKSFADAVPLTPPEQLENLYLKAKQEPEFSLPAFIKTHFSVPESYQEPSGESAKSASTHVLQLWSKLCRSSQNNSPYSTFIPVPGTMVVPGGRFREMYYWDTWFTMLGLSQAGKTDLIEGMVENFAFLIRNYGFVPNGLRSYFLSRSQPPFFSLMVELIEAINGPIVWLQYLDALETEYAFWMSGNRLVTLSGGGHLNRYWDDHPSPRPESYREDIELAAKSDRPSEELFRNIRAACESGWDFSSRWLSDPDDLRTIRTTRLVPVDLNCLLLHLEISLAKAYKAKRDIYRETEFTEKIIKRKSLILKHCWNDSTGWFHDFDLDRNEVSEVFTLAGSFPLFMQLVKDEKLERMAATISQLFLGIGGVQTTLHRSGQQWDAPNGWAPLQYITIQGLRKNNCKDLAKTISKNWLLLNERVFQETGKMMEKYNVMDPNAIAGGGEYPNQDGFGWTNGVYAQLKSQASNHG